MRSKLLAVFAAVVAMLIPAAPAEAGANAAPSRFTDETAFAQFSSLDPSGCVATTVIVAAGKFFSHLRPAPDQPLGKPDQVRQAGVLVAKFDSCTDTLLLDARGTKLVDQKTFEVSSQLTSAKLTTSFNVHDFVSNSNFDVSVDVTWSDAGPLVSSRDNIHFDFGSGCKGVTHFSDLSRLANVSGTVSDGATNFTPEATQGVLDSGKEGQVLLGGTACP
jgi:hypothetical protein